jgi:cytoskeletal protein RodZ
MDLKAHRHQPARRAPHDRRSATGRRRWGTAALGALALLVALLAIAPAVALAATTTGYSQTPPAPKTEPSTTTTAPKTTPAKQEVSPKEEKETVAKTTPAPSHAMAPTTTARASRLPFTGLDLRWLIVGGVLLVGSGLSIVVAQRSRRGERS